MNTNNENPTGLFNCLICGEQFIGEFKEARRDFYDHMMIVHDPDLDEPEARFMAAHPE